VVGIYHILSIEIWTIRTCPKGGSTRGTIEEIKIQREKAIIDAKSEITKRLLDLAKNKPKGKLQKTPKKIVNGVREKRNLYPSFDMSHWTVRNIIARG